MSRRLLTLVPVTQVDDWDRLVDRSPQGSLFSEIIYLQASQAPHRLYWILQGSAIKAGAILTTSSEGNACALHDLVIYTGLLFNLDEARPGVKRRHDEFQITEFFAGQMAGEYSSMEFQLSPEFADLRPFLWYRYHEPGGPKFKVDLRYTSYLDVSSLRDYRGREEDSPCFRGLETVRRYSIREANRKGGRVVRGGHGAALVRAYRALMTRQGTVPSEAKLVNMQSVMDALMAAGRGDTFHALCENGTVLYSVFYGWDSKRAYYLFGAGNPERSEPWPGTLVHWEAFKHLAQEREISEIDLEGVNSPQRGWFKLSFGGDLRPYFRVRYQ